MKRAIALGFFDGVHIGHGALLRRTREIAEKFSLSPCVLTYSNHPSEILSKKSVPLINSTSERIMLISEIYGIDDIVIKDFTKEYSELSCEEFFDKVIISELSCQYIVAGYDFRFGKGGKGDASTLLELSQKHGIGCDIIDAVIKNEKAVSSSRIRKLIGDGDMVQACELLGHYHCIESPVIEGQKLGRELGFPTANQAFGDNIRIPKKGVYLSRITIDGKTYKGITNIGSRPTVTSDEKIYAETHILSFSGNLYVKRIKTEFIRFLREEKAFPSKEALLAQISQDVLNIR